VTPEPTTCAYAVAKTIADHGVKTIYALPGVQNDWFFNALFDLDGAIRVVQTRHEQGAAYMALGAAMATGKPALYSVVPGPGFLNTTAALSTAYAANAPVFCLTGQIPSKAIGRGTGMLHEIPDQLGVLRSLTKWADRVAVPEEGAAKTAIAFRALRSGRSRPVGLEIPLDVLAAKGDFQPSAPLPPLDEPALDGRALTRAVDLLAGARRPMIFVGSGAQDAAPLVRAIAERLQAPVVSNRMGRGVLDSRHPLSLVNYAGYRLWKDCDVALGIGTRLQVPLGLWGTDERLKVIRVEADPEELERNRPADISLVGDAQSVLKRLAAALETVPAAASRSAEMDALKADVARDLAVLEPQVSYLQAIREVLPENGIFLEEMTQVGYVSRLTFPAYRPRTYLSSGYQGTLGWGFATAIGAKDALPDVPVVAACGDGGFMFNVQELATCVHHRIPLVTIVFSDGAYGNVRRMQEQLYGNRVIGSDLTNPDFVRLAESFGIKGERAVSPADLRRALDAALASGQPRLIEVPCGPMPSPWPFIQLKKIRG
jgi:acetolactate synthase-1/2/3 large subunit